MQSAHSFWQTNSQHGLSSTPNWEGESKLDFMLPKHHLTFQSKISYFLSHVNFVREDYKKDIFSMVSATDQAENSWCGEIKCVLSKPNFQILFKGLSLEIATSDPQKFLTFGAIFFTVTGKASDNPKCGRKFASIPMVFFCLLMVSCHIIPYCSSSC